MGPPFEGVRAGDLPGTGWVARGLFTSEDVPLPARAVVAAFVRVFLVFFAFLAFFAVFAAFAGFAGLFVLVVAFSVIGLFLVFFFSLVHFFSPLSRALGDGELFFHLEDHLAAIVSLSPALGYRASELRMNELHCFHLELIVGQTELGRGLLDGVVVQRALQPSEDGSFCGGVGFHLDMHTESLLGKQQVFRHPLRVALEAA